MSGTEPTPDFDPRWHGAFIPKSHYHFHRNLFERYGAVLEPGEYSRIQRKIAKGTALLIEKRDDNPGAVYAIWVKNSPQWVYIVCANSKLITALPPNKRLRNLHEETRNAKNSNEHKLQANQDKIEYFQPLTK